MQLVNEFNTVEQISEYTKNQVQIYRTYTTKKDQVIDALRPVYGPNSVKWQIVIDEGKFREAFLKKLGKKGMRSLKKLLYELDLDHFKNIDFDDE